MNKIDPETAFKKRFLTDAEFHNCLVCSKLMKTGEKPYHEKCYANLSDAEKAKL